VRIEEVWSIWETEGIQQAVGVRPTSEMQKLADPLVTTGHNAPFKGWRVKSRAHLNVGNSFWLWHSGAIGFVPCLFPCFVANDS